MPHKCSCYLCAGTWSYNVSGGARIDPETACASGICLRFTGGTTSSSTLYSSSFPLQLDKTYRVKFDLRAGQDGQSVNVSARRWDGQAYLGLQQQQIVSDTTWRTYRFIFKANASLSGRLDFDVSGASRIIYLDNVSFEEVTVEYNDPADDAMPLFNPGATPQTQSCADAGIDLSRCSEYVYFADATPVTWPVTVPAHGSVILVWAGNPFRDSDRDGVLDVEPDLCPGTTQTVGVGANGCAPTDLALTMTASAATVLVGDGFTYRLTVANNGNEGGGNVSITDTLPSGRLKCASR